MSRQGPCATLRLSPPTSPPPTKFFLLFFGVSLPALWCLSAAAASNLEPPCLYSRADMKQWKMLGAWDVMVQGAVFGPVLVDQQKNNNQKKKNKSAEKLSPLPPLLSREMSFCQVCVPWEKIKIQNFLSLALFPFDPCVCVRACARFHVCHHRKIEWSSRLEPFPS